jgi:hypothetical protein
MLYTLLLLDMPSAQILLSREHIPEYIVAAFLFTFFGRMKSTLNMLSYGFEVIAKLRACARRSDVPNPPRDFSFRLRVHDSIFCGKNR